LKFSRGFGTKISQKTDFCEPDFTNGAFMKTTFKIAVAALTLGVAAPAMAQQIDISTVTCGDAAAMPADALIMTIAFIDGYTGGEVGNTILDVDRLNSDLILVEGACAADPALTLMNAMIAALPAQ
jgi:hypothetical protein